MNNHYLTNRVASFLIVVSLLFSSGSGLLLFLGSSGSEALLPWQQGGDRIIGADYQVSNWTISGYDMTGNLTIRNGGIVSVSNGSLMFSQNLGNDGVPDTADDHIYTLIIEDGGKLILNNASLTTNLNQVHAYPSLAVIVRNGGVLESHNSVLKFPGYLIIDDASFILDNSVVTGFNATEIATYCDSRYFPVDSNTSAFDDSPVMLLTSANVVISDSSIERVFEPASGAIGMTYSHAYPFVNGKIGGAVTKYILSRMPAAATGGTGALSDLTMDDLKMYKVNKGQTININGIDTRGLVFGSNDGVNITLNIKYNTTAGFTGGAQAVKWNFLNSASQSTSIVPHDTTTTYDVNRQVTESYALPSMSSADLNNLHISYQNSDPGTASISINKIWVNLSIPLSTYKNITLAGSTKMTAINSYIGVDFSNDTLLHNVLAVRDNSNAYMYGVAVDMSQNPNPLSLREASFVAVEKKIDAIAQGSGLVEAANDNHWFIVANSATMTLNGFNTSGITGIVEKAELKVTYNTTAGYVQNNYVGWSKDGVTYTNTSIRPSATASFVTASYVLPEDQIGTLSDVKSLHVRFANSGGAGTINFDKVWVEVTLKPTIYIYRWSNLTVLDSQNLPVSGAHVDATLQNSPGTRAYYYSPSGLSNVPPQEVLSYLGRTALNFNQTGPNGVALTPLLSEVQDQNNPNPGQSLAYDLVIRYTNVTMVKFQNISTVSFVTYPSMDKAHQSVSQTVILSQLVIDKPDLYVSSLSAAPSNLYANDTITVSVDIHNGGATAATNVLVTITGYVDGTDAQWQANFTISTVEAGSTVPITAQWNLVPSGVHAITVKIDPSGVLVELSKLNNERSVKVTVLPNIPDLSVSASDVEFNPQPAYTGSQVTANVTIRNIAGRDNAVDALVEFFAGNPSSGGQILGSVFVNVPAGGSNQANLTWYPTQIGSYLVYVCVNRAQSIPEYDYSNNVAYKEIVVRLATSGEDLIIDGSAMHPNMTFINDVIPYDGRVVVKENGSLTLDGASLWILQNSQDELQVLVDNNGTLLLKDYSNMYSTYSMKLYLFRDAKLIVTNSQISHTMSILADDRAKMSIENSTIQPEVMAPSTSEATLYASNTTFQSAWSSFGGHATAYLTNISIPSLAPKDSAIVYHYRWMNVVVLDGTGARLPGAYVNLEYLTAGPYAHLKTDSNGNAVLRAMCDEITSSGTHFVGVYKLNASFNYGGHQYNSEAMNPSLDPYSSPLVKTVKRVTASIQTALPDLDPPIYLSDSTPGRNQVVNISTQINNTGVVPARNVLVRFTDNGNIINETTIPIIGAGGLANVWTNWTATYPLGLHNISIMVDPYGAIPELNKNNNLAWRMVLVNGVADLVIDSSGITLTSASPTMGEQTQIVAVVNNAGDAAASNINVTFYATIAGGSPVLIDYHIINYLDSNSSASPSVNWQPSLNGQYTITVKIDENGLITETTKSNNQASVSVTVKNFADLVASDLVLQPAGVADVGQTVIMQATVYNDGESAASNIDVKFYLGDPLLGNTIYEMTISGTIPSKGTYYVNGTWMASLPNGAMSSNEVIWVVINGDSFIPETSYSNNDFSQTIQIVENRPDLMFVGAVNISSGSTPVTSAGVLEKIDINAHLKNDGLTSAASVLVIFYAVDADKALHYIGEQVVDVSAGSTVRVNTSWIVNATMGQYNISIQANPGHLVKESNYSNNEILVNLTINAPNPSITISLGKTNFNAGEAILVQGYVLSTNTSLPIVNATVTVALYDVNGNIVGFPSTVVTTENGHYLTDLYISQEASGPLSVRVTVSIGDRTVSQSSGVQIGQITDTSVPWFIYVVILALVTAVIIGFSAYLYRYGLGKMVECGECGALIPESSKKCPKCGTEFEIGTAKCSECGAWIPASSATCPECGAKFISEAIDEQEDAYIQKMREQYEAFMASYKEEAKATLGKKYSDAKFADWWKKQPSYVSFEDWLSQEELKRKSGAFPCPLCGTPNSKGSTICHKCGTVFETPVKEAEKEGKEEKPKIRRIIKKSSSQKPAENPSAAPKDEAPATEKKQSP